VQQGEFRDHSVNAITLYNAKRHELGLLTIGPFRGTSAWHEESKPSHSTRNSRSDLRIGLFGATGTAAFDKLQIELQRLHSETRPKCVLPPEPDKAARG
jgi:hypothetical protein